LSLPAQTSTKTLLDEAGIAKSLSRIAHEIVEANPDLGRVALVGIHTRGVPLAHRLRRLIHEFRGEEIALGTVDITFYRDDVQVRAGEPPRRAQPLVRATKLDFPLEGRTVVLVDDVLYTGRTIRAAIVSSSPAWPIAATASFQSVPTTSARTCRPRARSGSKCNLSRSTRSTGSCSSRRPKRRADNR
jgi:hypoxanthine-guanine phosphoribosyltransferase